MKLAVEVSGRGRDLVLIHGWGMNRRVWDPLVEALPDGYRIHRVDLPGHGESPWDPAFGSLEKWSAAVLETVPSGADWVGWSLGGLVMLQAAKQAPQKIRSLVGIATTPCFVRRAGWEAAMEAGLLHRFAAQLEQDRETTLRRFLALQFQGVAQGRELQRQAMALLSALPAPRPGALATGLELLEGSDLRNDLSRLAQPALWLLGERDRLVPPQLGDLLAGLLPAVTVKSFPAAGHAPFLSHPRQVAQRISGFLSHE